VTPTRLAAASLVAGLLVACGHRGAGEKQLSKAEDENVPIPVVPEPPENGPRLGAIANVAPILDRPSKKGTQIGYLHAGETVARAAQPFSKLGCDGGWFPVRPRGFVCASATATTDMNHATLIAMAIQPKWDAPLPYAYARAVRDTTLYEVDGQKSDGVRALGKLRAKSGLAVVGSWSANDSEGKPMRLAMMTDGHFVPAVDLEAAQPSRFEGVALGDKASLPIAFVVKRGVRGWSVTGDEAEKKKLLDYHEMIYLTGKSRKIDGVEFWSTADGRYVRLTDVTLVRERHDFPAFATGEQKWIDVSVVTGTLVAYEGKKAVFATLASVGRDRLGAPESMAITQRGEFQIAGKHVTAAGRDPATFADGVGIYDVPWAVELSNGQLIVGAYWHDRFGIEHGPGNVELSPVDAAWLFHWMEPEIPTGWHAVTDKSKGEGVPIVNVRK
jgi:hypothetical protein